jgi:hypothetical protein
VAGANVAGSELLTRLTELYTAARFGQRAVAGDRLKELAGQLSDLGRPSAPSPSSSPPP